MDSWQDLVNHPDYEICTEYPHQIRKRSSRKILSEYLDNTGYYRLRLNGKPYLKHRLVADQFIPNDDPKVKTQVDHKNRDRTDNHIDNLRWCSPSENNLNQSRTKYDIRYVDELPELAIEVSHYGKHVGMTGLYSYDDVFYVHTRSHKYKVINKHTNCHGRDYIELFLPNSLRLKIYYNKFRREYGLN